jgi:hypothetical protein
MATAGLGNNKGRGPSPDELAAMMDPTRDMYGFTPKIVKEMQKALGTGINPLSSLPVATSDFYEAFAILTDDTEGEGGYEGYMDEVGSGKYYRQTEQEQGGTQDTPAPLSVIPTSTTNYLRPRTVAAGWDRNTGTLTVVFRDGTYYNYYNVEKTTWEAFKARQCKGCFIKDVLDYYERGFANTSDISAAARESLYSIIRTNQLLYMDERPLTKAYRTRKAKVQGTIPQGQPVASKQKLTANKQNKSASRKK